MFATIITISALLLAVFGMNLGFGLQATLLGVRAGLEAFALPMIGAIMALYYVGYIGGSLFGPGLINRIGHIRTFAALASIASAATLVHAIFVDPFTWMVLRTVTGFCLAGLIIVSESWLNHASNNTNRGSVLSTYMIVTLGATAISQFLLNTAPPEGSNLFILVSVLVSLSLVPLAITRSEAPPLKPKKPMPIKRLFIISPAGVAGCFATGLINGSFWGMGAVYAQKSGMLTQEISVFMAIVIVGGIITQWPLGKLSDHIDRRLVIIAIGFFITGASIALSLAGDMAIELRLIAGAFFGMAAFPLYAISIAHVNDKVKASDFVPASSALLVIYGIGAVMGPVISSVAMAQYGPGGLFYYTTIVALLLGIFSTHRLLTGKKVSNEDKEDFVSVPKTSQIAVNMAAAVNEEKAVDG
ncbi:MAG: MFS transporter [Rhodospirillaceae bacterium]|nr:MFS transporter [Rhodospirillaceae bacterium]